MSKKERLTDEELLAQFEGIVDNETPKPEAKPGAKPAVGDQDPDALLEELGIAERPRVSSRPHTPRTQTTSTTKSSPKVTRTGTPTSTDGARSSEEKAHLRKSGDSSRSFHNSFTPASSGEGDIESEKSTAPEAAQAQSLGGGWWGSVFSTASAAVKQAEALAKEIRQNEEAQRWAEQVKGNVGALRGLGMLSCYCSSHIPILTVSHRRRAPFPCSTNFHQHSPHPRPTYFFPRAPPDPYHT